MNSNNLFEAALSIESPWFIKHIKFSREDKQLDVYIDFKKGTKFTIEGFGENLKVHDTVNKTWRHLNFFQHECHLHCRTPRILNDDNKAKLVSPPWEGKSTGFTLLFEAFLLKMCQYMPVSNVSEITAVSDDKLWRMLERYVGLARKEEDYSEVTAVGFDETSRRKGYDYISLFVDLDKKKTMFVTEGKDAETVKEFVEDLSAHGGQMENITHASIDMSPAFISGATKYLPKAEITFDKFHIVKIINKAVGDIRREEAKIEPVLEKSRYAVLKNEENLTETQKKKRTEIESKGWLLKTYRAMRMREFFQEAYKATDLEAFEKHMYKWYWWASHSRLEPMKEAARTIKSHWAGIISWWRGRYNNGILEGLNSLIQAAKSKARGYRTTKNLIIIAYIITGDLDFKKINHEFV
jgi:transposase